jgi:hypothetical protein
MISIRKCVGRELSWMRRKTSRPPVYDLCDGNEIVATLRFHDGSGTSATAECADGCWTLTRRVGFIQTQVTIRKCGSDIDTAVSNSKTWSNRATIEQACGTTFLAGPSFWSSKFQIADASGETLIRFERRFGIVEPKQVIVIQPAAVELDETPWLALFGGYMTATSQSSDAVVVAG